MTRSADRIPTRKSNKPIPDANWLTPEEQDRVEERLVNKAIHRGFDKKTARRWAKDFVKGAST